MGAYSLVEMGWHGELNAKWDGELMNDLTKAMCYVNGQDYNEETITDSGSKERVFIKWHDALGRGEQEWGKWFEFNHFRVKVYKKKTIHIQFLDEGQWLRFNQIAAKAKGFTLAEKFTSDFRAKKNDVVKV